MRPRPRPWPSELGSGATAGTWGAAPAGDIVILAVLFASAVPVVSEYGDALAGKIVVDITNPFNPDATGLVMPDGSSGAQEIAKAAPASAHVVKAFNTLFSDVLAGWPPGGCVHGRRRRAGQGERLGVHHEPRPSPSGRRRPQHCALVGGRRPVGDGPGPHGLGFNFSLGINS